MFNDLIAIIVSFLKFLLFLCILPIFAVAALINIFTGKCENFIAKIDDIFF